MMALDYYIKMRNDDATFDSNAFLARLMSANTITRSEENNPIDWRGLTIKVVLIDDEPSEFDGNYPDICIGFRLNKFEHLEYATRKMLAVTGWLLTVTEADFEMTFNSDEVLLRRKNKQLFIIAANEFWTPAHIVLIKTSANGVSVEVDPGFRTSGRDR